MKNNFRNALRQVMVPVALVVSAFGLQSMRPVAAPAMEEDKPGQFVSINWESPVDCDMSISVTYVEYPDADCSALYQICRFTDCFNVSTGTPSVFVPGAGTILQVDLHCGSDCTGGNYTTAYVCDAVCIRSALDCCGVTYRVNGASDGAGGVTMNVVY